MVVANPATFKLEHDSTGVKAFLKGAFRYYTTLYAKIEGYALTRHAAQPWVYMNALNEMDSQYLLILSSCEIDDKYEDEKIKLVSRQLDRLFVLLRLQRAYDSNDFNEAIFRISAAIRGKSPGKIADAFDKELIKMLSENRSATVTEPFQYAHFKNTGASDMALRFVRYYFARIDEFLASEMNIGIKHPIEELVTKTGSKTGFHVEHILARNQENLDQYGGNEELFEVDRGRLGGILLLKGKDNQSSNNESYTEKLKSYANTLYWNETLRKDTYKSKIDLKSLITKYDLSLQPYASFGPAEVEARQRLLFDVSSIIWGNGN
jgi:hypothetical protein